MQDNESKMTPAEGLEASASPRRESGVGIQMAGAGSIPDAGNLQTTPIDMSREGLYKEIDRLRDGIKKVIHEGVQKTEGPYSPKNNKCKHGHYGYDGCEACIDEFLEELLNG